jgi:hypothetical protein
MIAQQRVSIALVPKVLRIAAGSKIKVTKHMKNIQLGLAAFHSDP